MMGKPAWVGLVGAIVLAFICGGIYAFTERSHVAEAQSVTTVGVDANPTGNTATSLGTINSCISVDLSDPTIEIDLFVQDVTDLNAWDATFRFDESVLEVNSLAVADFFLGSNVYTHFDCYTDGVCGVGGQDTTYAGHTGVGVLGRLELTAIGAGISEANLDLRLHGSLVSGVQLFDENGDPIGPLDGYGYFDGPILNAQIAVGEPCPGECLPDVHTDSDGFDDEVECYLGTDPLDDCPDDPTDDAWPLDIDMSGDLSVTGDVFYYRDCIGATPDDPEWWQRLDLDMSGDISVTGDVFLYVGAIGVTCS